MTLFEMYDLIRYIANKDYEGNVITPDNFKTLAVVANLDLLKIKLGLPEDLRPGQPLTRQYLDVNQLMTDDLKFLKTRVPAATVTAGVLSYPAGYLTWDTVRYGYQRNVDGVATVIPRMVEILTEDELSDRLGRWIKRPTTHDPVCVVRNDGIHIYPVTIQTVEFMYVRYPLDPVFLYTLNTGYITDPGGSTQFEWGKHLHNDLLRIILGYIGVNIRDEQIVQYVESKKNEGV